MDVVFAFNEQFIPGFISTARSLCLSNPGNHRFFLLHDGINENAIARIRRIMLRCNCTLFFVDIGQGFFEKEPYVGLPRYQRLSMARLLIHKYLPVDVERVLYLDVDLTINGSLQNFYETDFEDKALAAIAIRRDGRDGGPYRDQEAGVYNLIRIPLKESSLYFNAGVLLINVHVFRALSLSDYDAFVMRFKENLELADQDILNLMFEENVLRIVDRRLNCTIPNNMRLRQGEYEWIKKEVLILHYVVATKPWMYTKYTNRVFHIYMRYERKGGFLLSWFARYLVWYFLKPFHFLGHCRRKAFSVFKEHGKL